MRTLNGIFQGKQNRCCFFFWLVKKNSGRTGTAGLLCSACSPCDASETVSEVVAQWRWAGMRRIPRF